MKIIYWILIILLLPYFFGLLGFLSWELMSGIVANKIAITSFYLSIPGLFIVGIYLCIAAKRKLDWALGIAAIIFPILVIAGVIWLFSTNCC